MRYAIALITLLAAVLVPSPAHASLLRTEATSPTGTAPAKTATVLCGEGTSVLGMGGRTSDAQGNVVLTGITVDAALTKVTAWAHARPGFGGSWSVTAMAVCAPADYLSPERVVSAMGQGSATAQCQSPKILYSEGYLLTRADGNQYVHHVVPSAALSGVGVRAGTTMGAVPPDVIAIAVCALPIGMGMALRAEAATATDPTPVKNVIAPEPCACPGDAWMFGAGAAVTGGKDVFINAMTPTPDLAGARARAARAQFYGPAIRSMSTSDDGEDEDWQLTAYGTFIGSWY